MIVYECFSCAGGMAEGFRRAGLPITMAFDWNPDACESYARNLGHNPIRMDVSDLLRMCHSGWTPGEVDLWIFDPPCTPWSRAGKRRGLEDKRDMLRDTVELIRQLKPHCFLIGNVPGLDDSSNLRVVQSVIGAMWRVGYCVDYRKLDAAAFGVPQHRVRPFWFGHPRGSDCISWPTPTHGDTVSRQVALVPQLLPWVTCRDALGHLPPDQIGRPLRQRNNPKHPPSEPDAPAMTVTTSAARHQANTVAWRERRSGPDEPTRTIGTRRSNRLEWPWDRPATTICTDERLAGGGHHEDSWMSLRDVIALSEKAAAILQGLPEGWHFAGKSKAARWSQIGQAMPPALAHAVARQIVKWFARISRRDARCA